MHAAHGPAAEAGLGFYTFLRFHIDTRSFRRWGSAGPPGNECPCAVLERGEDPQAPPLPPPPSDAVAAADDTDPAAPAPAPAPAPVAAAAALKACAPLALGGGVANRAHRPGIGAISQPLETPRIFHYLVEMRQFIGSAAIAATLLSRPLPGRLGRPGHRRAAGAGRRSGGRRARFRAGACAGPGFGLPAHEHDHGSGLAPGQTAAGFPRLARPLAGEPRRARRLPRPPRRRGRRWRRPALAAGPHLLVLAAMRRRAVRGRARRQMGQYRHHPEVRPRRGRARGRPGRGALRLSQRGPQRLLRRRPAKRPPPVLRARSDPGEGRASTAAG